MKDENQQEELRAKIITEKPLIRFLVHKTFCVEAINEANGEVMGHVNLRKEKDGVLKIDGVLTQDKYRGKGVATALYKYIEEHSKGYKILKANIYNEASAALHEKTGFSSDKPYGDDGVAVYEKKVTPEVAHSKFSSKSETIALQQAKEERTQS